MGPFGIPLPFTLRIIRKDNFLILYDQSKRIPVWVSETLTEETLRGDAKRASGFYVESSVPAPFRSTGADYLGSGYDRGHMAPAANRKSSHDCMRQSFSLSNIIPQHRRSNQGMWKKLESHCRDLASSWDAVHVITGHLMMPVDAFDKNGNRIKVVAYEVIGANNVAVPTHLYKVVLCQRLNSADLTMAVQPSVHGGWLSNQVAEEFFDQSAPDQTLALHAYLIPNGDVGGDKKPDDFLTRLEDIERFSGFEKSTISMCLCMLALEYLRKRGALRDADGPSMHKKAKKMRGNRLNRPVAKDGLTDGTD